MSKPLRLGTHTAAAAVVSRGHQLAAPMRARRPAQEGGLAGDKG